MNPKQSALNESNGLKMKELVEKTGVSKATILFYINDGLLPKPEKKSANVVFYPPSFIEKIGFIKQLQSKHRLSLAQIKTILREREKGREITPLIELNEVVFGQKDTIEYGQKQFCKETGLTGSIVKRAISMQLIQPKEEGVFDSEDVAVGKMLQQIIGWGYDLDLLEFYPRLAEKIVKHEIEVQQEVIKERSFEDVISLTLQLTGAARSFRGYVIDRIFQKSVGQEDTIKIKKKQ